MTNTTTLNSLYVDSRGNTYIWSPDSMTSLVRDITSDGWGTVRGKPVHLAAQYVGKQSPPDLEALCVAAENQAAEREGTK